MKSKVLILGSDGMLGTALVKVFENYNVTAWDLGDLDITNRDNVFKKVQLLNPEVVINAAAYNAVDQAETNEGFTIANKINCDGVKNLSEVSESIGSKFVHFSTDYVFSGNDKAGYKEESEVNPINKYGLSKANGEKAVQETCSKYYLIRLSKLFGPAGKSKAGKKSFVDFLLNSYFEEGKREFRLVDEEVSSPTYSEDLAKRTLEIIESELPFGIYHGSNSGSCTWYEWGKEIAKLKSLEVNLVPVKGEEFKRSAKRPEYSELINTKLSPSRLWQEALQEYLS